MPPNNTQANFTFRRGPDVSESLVGGGAATRQQRIISLDSFRMTPRGQVPPPSASIPSWQDIVRKKLQAFSQLPRGWDSYDGQPLKPDAGYFAFSVLCAVMTDKTPVPELVPTPDGGVQLEWHEGNRDIELTVDAAYDCELWSRDPNTRASQTRLIRDPDLSPLVQELQRI